MTGDENNPNPVPGANEQMELPAGERTPPDHFVRVSPSTPQMDSPIIGGLVMKLTATAVLSPTIADDKVQRREMTVTDAVETKVYSLQPDTVSVDFTVNPAPGQEGQCFLVDYDQANNASPPSPTTRFPLDVPDQTPPTQPAAPIVTITGTMDDNPPPEPVNVMARVSGGMTASFRGGPRRPGVKVGTPLAERCQ